MKIKRAQVRLCHFALAKSVRFVTRSRACYLKEKTAGVNRAICRLSIETSSFHLPLRAQGILIGTPSPILKLLLGATV